MEQKILASVAFRERPEADISVGESSKSKFRSASFAAATRACNGIRKRCHHLGPGLIAGAADDDPSGIATYSQVGAQFGYSLGWVLLLTGPLLVAIQEISARVGYVTAQERGPSRPDRSPAQLRRIRLDTLLGAGGAMLIALCIMGSPAATLNVNGNVSIQTSAQAAEALRPIAGDIAFALFAAGIIGTGMLAVPALAASAAYAVAEAESYGDGF